MARTPSAVLTETKPSKAVKKAEKVKTLKADLKSAIKDLDKAKKVVDKILDKLEKLEGSKSVVEGDSTEVSSVSGTTVEAVAAA